MVVMVDAELDSRVMRFSQHPLPVVRGVRIESAFSRGRSRPIVVETEDDERYVVKLSDTPTATRRLIAEVIAGYIGVALGLPIPRFALIEMGPEVDIAPLEQANKEKFKSSTLIQFGSLLVPDAVSMRRKANYRIDPEMAGQIVWFDALVLNTDRMMRNPNLLVEGDELWLIDNDSAFSIHHQWASPRKRHELSITPSNGLLWWRIEEHVLLSSCSLVSSVGDALAARIDEAVVWAAIDAVPHLWFNEGFPEGSVTDPRDDYARIVLNRIEHRRDFEAHSDFLRSYGYCRERKK
ncbi:aminotransferase class I and II [soil metagenome]